MSKQFIRIPAIDNTNHVVGELVLKVDTVGKEIATSRKYRNIDRRGGKDKFA